MNLNFRLILFFTALLFSLKIFAQNGGNSPYSVLGIGDVSHPGYIRNLGMGGTGISNGHSEYINIQNPALLPVNKFHNKDSTIKFTMLEAGFFGQVRNLSTSKSNEVSNGFNINYFAFAFPVSSRWTTSFGLRPFSSIQNRVKTFLSYDKIREANVINAQNDYSINGALNQVQFSNGVDLSRNFSAGLLAGYIFGNVIEQSVTQAQLQANGTSSFNTGTHLHTYYTGFQLKPGFSYRGEFKDSSGRGSGTFINAGFTFDYLLGFNGDQSKKLIAKDEYDGISTLSDTSITSYNLTLPPTTSFGISIDQPDRWSLAFDATYSPWSTFRTLQGVYPKTAMSDSYSFALGVEIKPSRRLSLANKEYRAGISYTKSPITINNNQLDDIAVSFGASIPFGRKDARFKSKPLTKINAALVMGNRGTTDNGMIREQYFRLHLGVLISDKWFQRWRIE